MKYQPLKPLTVTLDKNDICCLEAVIENYWLDAARHFFAVGAPADHVFHLLTHLAAIIGHEKRNRPPVGE